jgi:hypothetical protein
VLASNNATGVVRFISTGIDFVVKGLTQAAKIGTPMKGSNLAVDASRRLTLDGS